MHGPAGAAGACSTLMTYAPMAAINDDYYEDLDAASLKAILDEFRAGRTPPPGSALGRQATAPVGGPLTLTDPTLYDGSRAKPFKLPNAPEAG